MITSKRKRNEYLDVLDSDEESLSNDSGAVDDSRTTQYQSKTLRVSAFSDDDDVPSSDAEPTSLQTSRTEQKRHNLSPFVIAPDNDEAAHLSPQLAEHRRLTPQRSSSQIIRSDAPSPPSTIKPQPENPNQLIAARKNAASSRVAYKPGVIYLSRIPPFMKPPTLRRLLSPHGIILRIFLTPEPHSIYLKRRSLGGNKKRSFIDGWVEFSRRKDARICAEALNATTIGGRGWYGDDVWNIRYLKKFTWEDLMGGVRREEREREERIRVGLGREGRERAEFLHGVERAKIEETRRAKASKKIKHDEAIAEGEDGSPSAPEQSGERKAKQPLGGSQMRFRQNELKTGDVRKTADGAEMNDDVKRVLSQIF